MSPLKYECIECHAQWGNQSRDDNDISHGFCKRCLRKLQSRFVHNNQAKQGFDQCYAKGHDDCTEYKCAFWSSCLDRTIQEWEKENINGHGGENNTDVQRRDKVA
jgi:hypothetical protein